MLASPRRSSPPLGFAIAAIGLGLVLWFGYDWMRLPSLSDQEIAQQVDAAMAADVMRNPDGSKPDAAQVELLKAHVREEIAGEIDAQRNQAKLGTLVGLAAAVFGVLQMALLRRSSP